MDIGKVYKPKNFIFLKMLVVKAQIKDVVKAEGLDNVSSDFAERLDKKVQETIKEACRRAKENGRKTVMGKDL